LTFSISHLKDPKPIPVAIGIEIRNHVW